MTEGLAQVSLHEPLWLFLALLPFIVLAWHKSNYQLPARLKEFADPHLWRWLITQPDKEKASLPWLLLVAWLLATIALSEPYIKQQQPETRQQRGMDIAVVIDISPSMKTRDVFPSRLERVKLEMQDFVANLKGDRTALIAFSANTYKILPLTHDHDTLLHFTRALDVTLTRRHGSNITQALELARQTLAASRPGSRAIVLISDGESDDNTSTMAAAQRLNKDAIPLYILGVGTDAGGPVEDDIGRLLHYHDEVVISRIQRPTLISLASLGSGVYTDLKDDNSDWQQLFTAMDKLERKNVYQVLDAQHDYQLYPWLLGLSIILFILSGTRRIEVLVLVLLVPLTIGNDVQAAPWEEQNAYDAFNNKDYGKANITYEQIQTFNGQLGKGAAAYRLGDWQQALEAFSRAGQLATNDKERAKAAYNRGNTLAHMGNLDKASAAFEEALTLQKNYPRAALNLSIINKSRMQLGTNTSNKPDITRDARDALSDRNAELNKTSVANTEQESAGTSKESSADASTHQTSHKEIVDQTVAQWNLGGTGTDDALESALWQLRSLNDTPNALLRMRFNEQDAQHPVIAEERPW